MNSNILIAARRNPASNVERNRYYVVLMNNRGVQRVQIHLSWASCYAQVRRLRVVIPRADGLITPSAPDLDPHATFHGWPTLAEAQHYIFGAGFGREAIYEADLQ